MRKRYIALLVTLALLMGLLPGALAQETPSSLDVEVSEMTWMSSAAWRKGEMILGGNGLFAWKPGEDKLRSILSFGDEAWAEAGLAVNATILADGDSLYAPGPAAGEDLSHDPF